MGENKSNHLIIMSLFFGLFSLTAITSLLVRYSQGILKENYIKTSAVFVTESSKLVFAVVMIVISRIQKGKSHSLINHFVMLTRECYWLLPSAIIYLTLNYLLYFCLSHLEAVVFTVLYQLKIFTSAFMTIIILRRKISLQRWMSLILLFVGIIFVKLDKLSRETVSSSSSSSTSSPLMDGVETKNTWMGFLGVILMSFCSGLAGVYFELVLKKKKTDDLGLWERNYQLYLPGVIFSLLSAVIANYQIVQSRGMFSGMSYITFSCAFLWAVTGIVTSLVLKYGSSVLNAFGSGTSLVATAVGSFYFEGFHITVGFLFGTVLVVIATALYQLPFKDLVAVFWKIGVEESKKPNDDSKNVEKEDVHLQHEIDDDDTDFVHEDAHESLYSRKKDVEKEEIIDVV